MTATAPAFHESPIDRLPSRLERVKATGPGRPPAPASGRQAAPAPCTTTATAVRA